MAHRVGGEVDSQCTRCKMILAHTIIAMVGAKPVRVQCNTCGGQHNFHAPSSASESAAKVRKPATERSAVTRMTFDEALASKGPGGRPYSPKVTFLVNEVVNHPTFGAGWVDAVRGDKVDIVFKAGTRTLVHGRG